MTKKNTTNIKKVNVEFDGTRPEGRENILKWTEEVTTMADGLQEFLEHWFGKESIHELDDYAFDYAFEETKYTDIDTHSIEFAGLVELRRLQFTRAAYQAHIDYPTTNELNFASDEEMKERVRKCYELSGDLEEDVDDVSIE